MPRIALLASRRVVVQALSLVALSLAVLGLGIAAVGLVQPASAYAQQEEADSDRPYRRTTYTGRATPEDEEAAKADAAFAAYLDQLLSRRWYDEDIQAADPADDYEFLRRAWLDLAGTIPPLNEKSEDGDFGVRGYLADARSDKRHRLVNHLVMRPSFASHMATIWTNVMVPDETNVMQYGDRFRDWLRYKFRINEPYDRLVKELLLARGTVGTTGPILFYTSSGLAPEQLAASTSRVFMGVQIQCAQCHDHPFDDWTRDEFWGFAAFFAQLERPEDDQAFSATVSDADEGEVTFPETDNVLEPRFLRGQKSPDDGNLRRLRLADWLTSADNEYFSRAAANRAWAIMFGRGLVDPVDDLGDHNPAVIPEVLEALSEYFVSTDYDLRRLFRAIALTDAYRLSSDSDSEQTERLKWFAQMSLKSLTAEQLYDSLAEAMRSRETTQFGRVREVTQGVDQNRVAFVSKFRAPTLRTVDYEAGIPQALTLMNGTVMHQATDLLESDLLASLHDPFFSDRQRLEILFLATLSRPPSDDEQTQLLSFVKSGGAEGNRREAYSDILWALLNSAEFVFNH